MGDDSNYYLTVEFAKPPFVPTAEMTAGTGTTAHERSPRKPAALQQRDKDKADEVLRAAYLPAVPAMVEATLRHMAPSIAEQYRAKICAKSHVTLIPAPVQAKAPKAMKEVTRVTKHDPQDRILEFVREQVEA